MFNLKTLLHAMFLKHLSEKAYCQDTECEKATPVW